MRPVRRRVADLINKREVLFDNLFAVGAVEVGLRCGGQGEAAVATDENEPTTGEYGQRRYCNCDLDEVDDFKHKLKHHCGVHVASSGGYEVPERAA